MPLRKVIDQTIYVYTNKYKHIKIFYPKFWNNSTIIHNSKHFQIKELSGLACKISNSELQKFFVIYTVSPKTFNKWTHNLTSIEYLVSFDSI